MYLSIIRTVMEIRKTAMAVTNRFIHNEEMILNFREFIFGKYLLDLPKKRIGN